MNDLSNKLEQFMKKHFDDLVLAPGLFYSWRYGLRFEISNPDLSFQEKANLKQVYERSTDIFKRVFDENDEVLLVTNIYCHKADTFLQSKPLNVYRKYVKNRKSINKLRHDVLPSIEWDDEESDEYNNEVTHRFIFQCKKSEVRYTQLLLAISYEDFGHQSRILKGFPRNGYDIFFVNISKKIIYHLYDDRGCDVIAADRENIRLLYEVRNEWILDYDRDKIDSTFR